MLRKLPLTALALAALSWAALGTPAMAGGDANILLGLKNLSTDADPEIDGFESQTQYGVMLNFDKDWPVSLAVDILMSSGDDTGFEGYYYYPGYGYYDYSYTYDVETTEIAVGVRKFWGENKVRGYVGGGPAWIQGDIKERINISGAVVSDSLTLFSADDSAFGFWVNAGVLWHLGERYQIGIDARYSDAEGTFSDGDDRFKDDIGGTHIGVFFGFRWGD